MRSRRWARALTGALGLLAITGTAGASPPVWQPQARLSADGEPSMFSWAVALQGDTALIGTSGSLGGDRPGGAADVFVRTGTTWSRRARLDTRPGERLARSAALDGDTVVLASQGYTGTDTFIPSKIHIFTRTGDEWTRQAELTDLPIKSINRLALSRDTLLLASHGEAPEVAQVQVLVRSGSAWSKQGTLPIPPGHVGQPSVAIDGETAIVGTYSRASPGVTAVQVLVRTGSTWTQQATLEPGEPLDRGTFGLHVAIHGDTALVSASRADPTDDPGAVYVFHRTGTDWKQQARLQPADVPSDFMFGTALSLHGDRAIVSGVRSQGGPVFEGTTHVFARSGNTWRQEARLQIGGAASQDQVGHAVAIHGQTAVVGHIPNVDGVARGGSAHVFTLAAPVGDPCGPGLPDCAVACVRGACADSPPALELEGGCATSLPGQRAPATVALVVLGLVAVAARRPSHPPLRQAKGRRRG